MRTLARCYAIPGRITQNYSPFYRLQQAQPQAIKRSATMNISAPTGKTIAIKIPTPSATAQIPSGQQPFP
jgi:hypothetical protein